MILGFMGNLGSGKTLGATIFSYYLYYISDEKMKIVSNYYLKGAYKLKNINQIFKTYNSIIVLDEIHTYIDSRNWKYNKKLIDYFLQLRKYNNYLIFTTQHFKQIDVRLRNITQHLFLCEKKENYFQYLLIDTLYKTIIRKFKIPFEKAKFFFDFYNTFEKIERKKEPTPQMVEMVYS